MHQPRSRVVRSVHPHACGADLRREDPRLSHLRFIPTRVGRTPQSRHQRKK